MRKIDCWYQWTNT